MKISLNRSAGFGISINLGRRGERRVRLEIGLFECGAKLPSARFAGLAGALKKRYIGENL